MKLGLPGVFLLQQAVFWQETYQNALIIPEWYLSAMLLAMLFMFPVMLLFRRMEMGCYFISFLMGIVPVPSSNQLLYMALTIVIVFIGMTVTFSGKGVQLQSDKLNQVFGYLGAISLPIYLFHPVTIDTLTFIKPEMSLGLKSLLVFTLTGIFAVLFKVVNDKRVSLNKSASPQRPAGS